MTNDLVSLGFDLSQLLDKTEEQATALAKTAGREVRVLERDGKALVVTRDLHPARVNLVVVEGVVSSYSLG